MDPISIISLAGSTTKSVYQISTQIYVFINRVKEADETLVALSTELSGLRRSLDAISNALQNPLARSEKASAPENAPIWAAVAGALEDCRNSLQTFEKKIAPLVSEKNRRTFLKKSITVFKLNLSDADIKAIRDQINTHSNSLQIALQTVNILISGLSPAKAAEDIGQKINILADNIKNVSLRSDESFAPHSAQVQAAARSVVSGAPELISTGLLNNSDEQVKTASTKLLRSVIAEYEQSLKSANEDEMINDGGDDDDECSSDEEDLGKSLANEHFSEGDKAFANKKYDDAEKHYRDGLRHCANLSEASSPQDLDLEGVRLKLARALFYQERLEEAELMFLILAKNTPASRAQVLQAYHYLGQIYLCLFDFDSAIEYTSLALKGRKSAFGKNDTRYLSSIQLFALLHEANGDIITANAYTKRIPSAQDLEGENTMIVQRYSGYSQADHLRMSLKEKQEALKQLSEAKFLTEEDAPRPIKRPTAFKLGGDSLNKSQALQWAAEQNKHLMAKWLLSQGADVDGGYDTSPIVAAGGMGHETIVRLLLDSGAQKEAEAGIDAKESALSAAALRGHESTVCTLLEYGASANSVITDGRYVTRFGNTPLINAAEKGHISLMDILVARGADMNHENRYGNTPVQHAIRHRQPDAAKWLITHGAETDTVALSLAISKHYDPLLKLMLEKGTEVNSKEPGFYPLLHVVTSPFGRGRVEDPDLVQLLLDYGADVNGTDKNGQTALWQCCDEDRPKELAVLLENKADPNIPNNKDLLPLARLKHRSSPECMAVAERFGGFKDCLDQGKTCADCEKYGS